MKCQTPFSWKNKKNVSMCRLLKLLPNMLSVYSGMLNAFVFIYGSVEVSLIYVLTLKFWHSILTNLL